MVATAIYSVTMVLWKETAFLLCRAMERRWKRNVVSLGVFRESGDMPANLLCELNGHYYYLLTSTNKPTGIFTTYQ